MNELLQAVLDGNFVDFNTKFKDKLEDQYEEKIKIVKDEFGKAVITELAVNVGPKKIKCKACGKELPIGIPVMGSCPFCGALVT